MDIQIYRLERERRRGLLHKSIYNCQELHILSLHEKSPYSQFLWSLFSRIQSECGKMWTRKTPNTDFSKNQTMTGCRFLSAEHFNCFKVVKTKILKMILKKHNARFHSYQFFNNGFQRKQLHPARICFSFLQFTFNLL